MNFIFDKQKLQELFVDYYTLTGIWMTILNNAFSEIMICTNKECFEYRDFCLLFREIPALNSRCYEDRYENCRTCRSTGRLHLSKCYMGFTKAIAPIKVNDIVFGYISIGPVLDSNDKAETLKKCVENGWYDTGKEKLSLALDKMVCKDTGYIKAAAKMLETYVSHLCLAKLISVDEGNLVYRISSHIRENLHEDLSVEKLCDVFMLSRRKLYELSSKYFGMSIAKYIRKRRIDFAAELIDESECLVCEAADRAGFEDSNYFSKVFKQEKGVLPSRYKVIEKPGDH